MDKFDGTYFKHQKGGRSLAIVAGTGLDHAFLQVLGPGTSLYFRYPLSLYVPGETVKIGGSLFSRDGVSVRAQGPDGSVCGDLRYTEQTPLRYDIMGPFRFLPMQCRHRIVSLHHRLSGSLAIDGETVDLTGGIGYMEGDSGRSFPKRYAWIQCNDFPEKACVTVSVADIPLGRMSFRGCIGVLYFHGAEHRLATYLGARVLVCAENRIVLRQGALCLEIEIDGGAGQKLLAPAEGKMVREIRERLSCGAHFQLTRDGKVLFEQASGGASFEYT